MSTTSVSSAAKSTAAVTTATSSGPDKAKLASKAAKAQSAFPPDLLEPPAKKTTTTAQKSTTPAKTSSTPAAEAPKATKPATPAPAAGTGTDITVDTSDQLDVFSGFDRQQAIDEVVNDKAIDTVAHVEDSAALGGYATAAVQSDAVANGVSDVLRYRRRERFERWQTGQAEPVKPTSGKGGTATPQPVSAEQALGLDEAPITLGEAKAVGTLLNPVQRMNSSLFESSVRKQMQIRARTDAEDWTMALKSKANSLPEPRANVAVDQPGTLTQMSQFIAAVAEASTQHVAPAVGLMSNSLGNKA